MCLLHRDMAWASSFPGLWCQLNAKNFGHRKEARLLVPIFKDFPVLQEMKSFGPSSITLWRSVSLEVGEAAGVILVYGTHPSCTSFVSIILLDIHRDLFPHLVARIQKKKRPTYPTVGSDSTFLTLCLQKQRVNIGLCSLQWMFSCLHCVSLKEWSTESFLCHLCHSNEKWLVGKGYWIPKNGNPSTFLFSRNRLLNGSVNYGVFIPSLDCQLLKNFWELLRTSVISLSGWRLCLPFLFSVPFIHGACIFSIKD